MSYTPPESSKILEIYLLIAQYPMLASDIRRRMREELFRRTLTYDVPEAPVGYDLGTASAKILPPYRGGYLVTAGSDYSVTALGTLIGLDAAPVSLLSGKATEIGVSNPRTLTIFTNRTGRFGISGMRPGRWRIEMPTEPPTIVEIVIPAKSLGVVRLGDVTLGDAQ